VIPPRCFQPSEFLLVPLLRSSFKRMQDPRLIRRRPFVGQELRFPLRGVFSFFQTSSGFPPMRSGRDRSSSRCVPGDPSDRSVLQRLSHRPLLVLLDLLSFSWKRTIVAVTGTFLSFVSTFQESRPSPKEFHFSLAPEYEFSFLKTLGDERISSFV